MKGGSAQDGATVLDPDLDSRLDEGGDAEEGFVAEGLQLGVGWG